LPDGNGFNANKLFLSMFLGLCLIMISRNTRCLARLCSSLEDLALTLGFLMGRVVEVPQQGVQDKETSTRMMTTIFTVKHSASLHLTFLCANYLKYLQL